MLQKLFFLVATELMTLQELQIVLMLHATWIDVAPGEDATWLNVAHGV